MAYTAYDTTATITTTNNNNNSRKKIFVRTIKRDRQLANKNFVSPFFTHNGDKNLSKFYSLLNLFNIYEREELQFKRLSHQSKYRCQAYADSKKQGQMKLLLKLIRRSSLCLVPKNIPWLSPKAAPILLFKVASDL